MSHRKLLFISHLFALKTKYENILNVEEDLTTMPQKINTELCTCFKNEIWKHTKCWKGLTTVSQKINTEHSRIIECYSFHKKITTSNGYIKWTFFLFHHYVFWIHFSIYALTRKELEAHKRCVILEVLRGSIKAF